MADPRVAKLADLLVNYSLKLKPGHVVRIAGGTVGAPLITELYHTDLRVGVEGRRWLAADG